MPKVLGKAARGKRMKHKESMNFRLPELTDRIFVLRIIWSSALRC